MRKRNDPSIHGLPIAHRIDQEGLHPTEDKLKAVQDAPPTGLGAVLSHRYPSGSGRPIGYASRTLTAAENYYSQRNQVSLPGKPQFNHGIGLLTLGQESMQISQDPSMAKWHSSSLMLTRSGLKPMHPLSSITVTAAATIRCCRHFCNFGLPEVMVIDNGPAFVSTEFEQFLKKNGIRHKTSAPYHPATWNGHSTTYTGCNGQVFVISGTVMQCLSLSGAS